MPGGPLPSSGSLGPRFATFPGTMGRYDSQHPISTDSGLPCPPIPLSHPFASLPPTADGFWWRARSFFNPGLRLPASFEEGLGPPKFPNLPCRGMPRSPIPVDSPAAPPLAAKDAAFRAEEHVGIATTYTRFRDSMTRPTPSLALAPYDWVAPTHAEFATDLPAGFGWAGLSPLRFLGGHPLGDIDEFRGERQSPRLGLRLAQLLRGQEVGRSSPLCPASLLGREDGPPDGKRVA